MAKIFLILFLIFLPITVFGHSPMSSVNPKDGAVLKKSPIKIEMNFESSVKLIKLNMQKLQSEKDGSLLNSLFSKDDGDRIALNNEFLMKTSERHSVELPELSTGAYTVKWRALGEDGHVIKGSFSFKVLGE